MCLCYPSLYLFLKTLYEINLIICHPFDIKTKTVSITFTSDIFIENVTIVTHIRKHVLLAQNKLTCRIPSHLFPIYFKVTWTLQCNVCERTKLQSIATCSDQFTPYLQKAAKCSQFFHSTLYPMSPIFIMASSTISWGLRGLKKV